MRRSLKGLFTIGILGVTSAAAPPEKFFHAVPHHTPDIVGTADPEYRLSTGELRPQIVDELAKGNEVIGVSEWNGPQGGKAAIVRQGRKIGATLVIYAEKFAGTVDGGTIGTASFTRHSAFGMSVPITVTRFDQAAVYFRHGPRIGIGIMPQPITPEERQKLGTNMGIKVGNVVPGSPAFLADVLPGDVIMSIGGTGVYDPASLTAAVAAGYGKATKFVLNRNGAEVDKTLKLTADGTW